MAQLHVPMGGVKIGPQPAGSRGDGVYQDAPGLAFRLGPAPLAWGNVLIGNAVGPPLKAAYIHE